MSKIFKFGGASVKNADAIINLKEIVSSKKEGLAVIIVSAMDKTTNKLEKNLLFIATQNMISDKLDCNTNKYDNYLFFSFLYAHSIPVVLKTSIAGINLEIKPNFLQPHGRSFL